MCVRPAPASTVITISLVGGAWTLDTNIPSPFTLTFYRVATWKPFYLPPFTLTFYRVTTLSLFILIQSGHLDMNMSPFYTFII